MPKPMDLEDVVLGHDLNTPGIFSNAIKEDLNASAGQAKDAD